MKTHSQPSRKGFTLVELLVAMAITSIIVVVLISVTSMALDTWNRSRSELRATRQGKALIDTMARDFESMVVRSGNNFEWLYANVAIPTNGPNGNLSPNASELIFFNGATDRYNGGVGTSTDLGGDVSCVGYKLAYQDPISAAGTADTMTFALYRKLVDPNVTFTSLLGQANLQTAYAGIAAGVNATESLQNFVCENIYQFTLTFHVDTGAANTVPVVMNSSNPMRIAGNQLTMNGAINTAAKVKSVSISITVLSDFGLQQMKKRPFASSAEKAAFIAKNSYEYSKLVSVPSL
jgi:prepilin-type N-terminal cleavage/methylation domain-containing protein